MTEKSKKVIDNTLKMVYIIPCITAVVRQPDAGKYARVAQWWSTSLPRRGSRVRSPSRALDNKKGYPSGYPFLLSRSARHFSKPNCFAVWVRFLGALKRPSVVPEPRYTGPCGTRLAFLKCKLLYSKGSISRRAKALLGRVRTKVFRL